MTLAEKQQIVEDVLFALRKNSKEINELSLVQKLASGDYIELSGGKRISAIDLAKGLVGTFIQKYIDDNFLSSKNDDSAEGNIGFKKNVGVDGMLTIGNFVDSLLKGTGTGIMPDGRIQTDRLEVRGSMTVMDLIINEIHAMAGEWNFSDCGKIEKVEKLIGEDGRISYKLWMEKVSEHDITNLEEDDVLLSIVNTLRTKGKDYYSSWMRCVNKNVNENSITVILWPDKSVPGGKNFEPAEGFNITRRGNSRVPAEGEVNERSQSWFLSSKEGRILFLTNVYKPILEEYNYALSLGKLPDVKALRNIGVVGDIGLYAQTIACEKLYEIDWNGDLIPRKVDRGPWSLAVANGNRPYRYVTRENKYPDGKLYTELEQHTVWHHGCKWGCLIDKTKDEPQWNSPGWVMIEGDPSYYLDFKSSNGWHFRIGRADTVVSAIVTYANRDITEILMSNPATSVEWFRDTKDPVTDSAWKPERIEANGSVIHLTNKDMGDGWGITYREVEFICKVFIPIDGSTSVVENNINIKM